MLPVAAHRPTGLAEPIIRVAVPLSVRGDLGSPERPIGAWNDVVLRTTVPVAAVDEYRDPTPCEDDVPAASTIDHERMIDPVAVAERMERTTDAEFRTGVPSTVRPHRRARRGTGRPRPTLIAHESQPPRPDRNGPNCRIDPIA